MGKRRFEMHEYRQIIVRPALQRKYGFRGAYHAAQRFVKKIKAKLSVKATTILEFKPGECAQVDFGAGPKLIDDITDEIIPTWIFVMALAWSRHFYAEIVLHQTSETWLGCHRRAFNFLMEFQKELLLTTQSVQSLKLVIMIRLHSVLMVNLQKDMVLLFLHVPLLTRKKKYR